MKKCLLIFLFVLILGALTACGGQQDEALVGTWVWEGNVSYEYVFNSDGTGRRGEAEMLIFTWSVRRDGRLILDFGRDYENDDWIYTIEDYNLTLVRREDPSESYTYFRVDHNADLVGVWVWEFDESYELAFHAEGDGSRGFLPAADPFRWFTSGGRLLMNVGPGVDEHWDFTRASLEIDGENRDVLTITNRLVPGVTYSYIRAR